MLGSEADIGNLRIETYQLDQGRCWRPSGLGLETRLET